jgi:NAD(P)-dependent dehydrogenase (short-subunit alcohol dehydrogenase family)
MFEKKTAVITGGGTGIGRATAEALLAKGAMVVLNGRREDVLRDAARTLDPSGRRVCVHAGDIGRNDVAEAIVRTAEGKFGGVDMLVNAAGIFCPKPFLEHTANDVASYVDTILKGTFFASQAAAKAMKKRGGGAIVHVGSMWADLAVAATPSSAYSAAKAGVHALTRTLALELAAQKIRVNCVAPAVVDTPVYETFLPPDQLRSVLDSFHAFHPIGRIGQARDVAAAILFLLGDSSAWITGTVLPVDGGATAGRP